MFIASDPLHSVEEERFKAIGAGAGGRKLLVVFTRRKLGGESFIRPVSARYMHRREIKSYEKETSRPDH